MNVAEAKDIYKKHAQALYGDDNTIAQFYQSNKLEQSISNSTYLHALFLTDIMLRNTHRALSWLAGASFCGFIDAMEETFKDTMRRIAAIGGKSRFLIVNGDTPPLINELAEEVVGVEVRCLDCRLPNKLKHIIVCDSWMARDEQPHDTLSGESDVTSVKADVFFYNPRVAMHLNRDFESMWIKEKPLL